MAHDFVGSPAISYFLMIKDGPDLGLMNYTRTHTHSLTPCVCMCALFLGERLNLHRNLIFAPKIPQFLASKGDIFTTEEKIVFMPLSHRRRRQRAAASWRTSRKRSEEKV